ncbi:MAG: UbiA family prenyltransferase [Polyangia bacterium]
MQNKTPLQALAFELRLSWSFIWRDLSTTMLPALLFMAAALKTRADLSAPALTLALLKWALYFWLYIYTFCLADQIAGVEEDRINKPDRPIASGLVTRPGAVRRWCLYSLIFLVAGALFGVAHWALLWLLASVLHNFCGWDKNWFTKNNVVMPLGFLAEVGAAWQLVAPLSPIAWRWLVVGALVVSMTAAIQDFRDVRGDRLTGRRTLPIVLGDHRARLVMCLSFASMCLLMHVALWGGSGLKGILCDLWFCGLALYICGRLLIYRTARADDTTYMVYTYWYCSILASAVVII